MFVFPPNLYVKILTPLGDGIGRWGLGVKGHEGGALVNRVSTFIKEPHRAPSHHVRTEPGSASDGQTRKRMLNQNMTNDGALILDFPVSRAVSNKFQFINCPVCLVFCCSSSEV